MSAFGSAVFGSAVFGGEPAPTGPPPSAVPASVVVTERLEEAGLGVLVLGEDNGYQVRSLDLGSPEVRSVVAGRINASGVDDRTMLTGARAVTFTVDCFAPRDGSTSRRVVLERLRAYADPSRRPVLVFAEDDGVERRVVLRGEPPSWPLTGFGQDVSVQMAFTAPSGLIEDYAATTVVAPAAAPVSGGRSYPKTYPLAYVAASLGAVEGAVAVVNGAPWNARADHVARLYGPCTGPRLVNVTTGGVLSLPGLVLAGDQFAEVDTKEATIRLNGRASETLYGHQEWGVSTFWQLVGGVNQVRYVPEEFEDESCRAEIDFRAATL